MRITPDRLPRLRRALQSNEWFAQCSEDFQHDLISFGTVRCLADGEILFEKNQIADGFFCILSGCIRVHHVGTGKPVLLLDYFSYDWIGELPMIDDLPDGIVATSMGATTLMQINHTLIFKWLDDNPVHWREFARLICRRFRYGVLMLLHATALSLEKRIMQRLHLISTSYGMRSTPTSRICYSQEELASMVGASRPSVTRALGKLAQQGLLELRYGEIYLLQTRSPLR